MTFKKGDLVKVSEQGMPFYHDLLDGFSELRSGGDTGLRIRNSIRKVIDGAIGIIVSVDVERKNEKNVLLPPIFVKFQDTCSDGFWNHPEDLEHVN